MNRERRKRLEDIGQAVEDQLRLLQEVYEDEQEAFENLPDGLKATDRGEDIQKALWAIEDSLRNMETAHDGFYQLKYNI